VEALQKQLARELGTDAAATPVSQTTRLPSFYNRKYDTPYLITVAYRDVDRIFTPTDFPATGQAADYRADPRHCLPYGSSVERARRYLEQVWTVHGLVTYYMAFVIELHSRRVHVLGSTPHPDEAFVVQTMRHLTDDIDGVLRANRVLICDRDRKWRPGASDSSKQPVSR
jgi:hypothetical protein